ncbi:MAG: crotonase/enoyl-CoA hydratase family protein [Acidimicrobiia bacterium]
MADLLEIRNEHAFTVVTLDDGKVNVLSREMFAAIDDAVDAAVERGLPVLLAGREGILSAGFDLKVIRRGDADAQAMVRAGFELSYRLLSLPVPVVIACTGHAIAMGVFLLLSGDYRVGTSGDYRIGANEVAIGIPMPDFGIEICRQRLTPAAFNRAVINAEMFDPEEAVAAGFLDVAAKRSDVMDIAEGMAAQLGAFDARVHTKTKLRTRAASLAAIRAAIDAGPAAWGLSG